MPSKEPLNEKWVAFKDPDGDWHVRIEGDDGEWICSLSWVGQSEERTRLLAAAPELLAEVKRLRARIVALCKYPRTRFIQNQSLVESHLEETDALIAKAEGS